MAELGFYNRIFYAFSGMIDDCHPSQVPILSLALPLGNFKILQSSNRTSLSSHPAQDGYVADSIIRKTWGKIRKIFISHMQKIVSQAQVKLNVALLV